jgi:erythromycin esterase
VDSIEAMARERQLEVLANPYTTWKFLDQPKEQQDETAAAIHAVLRRLDDHRSEYVSRTDSTSWALARQHARVLAQFVERMSTVSRPDGWMVRDSAMAENIRWILEHEGPGAKMVVWAWNGHVSMAPGSMGAHLRNVLGPDMVVFGFAFNQGAFQAIERPMPSTAGLRVFTVKPGSEGSLDATLAAAGLRLAAIDLRKLPKKGPVADWWSHAHETRNVGASYDGLATATWRPQIVTHLYDALLFIESTTPSQSNPGGRVAGRALLGAPTNLDFEDGELGEPPPGWLIGLYPPGAFDEGIATFRDFDFDLTTSDDGPYHGKRSGMIARPPGRHYGEAYGLLGQRIEAAPYRGKRVRLRAAVRTNVTGPGNEAYLWLRVTKAWAFPPSTVFYDDMSDRPITTSEWREYEIVGEVPEDAEMIDYGLALVGDGRAWIDAVSVELDEEGL